MAIIPGEEILLDQSFIKVKYGDNEEAIFNPWCSTYTLLEWIRKRCKCGHDITIDLIDLEGHVRNLSTGIEEYANDLLHGRETYILIRVERESESGPNRYISLLNNLEQTNPELMVKLNNLSRPTTRNKKDRPKKNNNNHGSRSLKGHRLESPTKRPTSSERHNKHTK
ncbi:uncharacterized protein CXorf65 homolog [Patella vulgata]|uniref:uncharacterized protein CXorf65 homolog n=1 Tax=Patella vulgata TaxID=6465 RepID=UPI0021802488|nr:uncharacterized protein CXorf65 homolog [Patella vulgata]